MLGNTKRSLTRLACAAAITVGLAGCGGQELAGGPGPLNSGNQERGTAADGPEPGMEDLAKDVEVTKCIAEEPFGVSAVVKVTNSFDEPWEYVGHLDFIDSSGKTVVDGVFNTGTLRPGETSTEDVPGINVYEPVPGVTCELAEIHLDEPGNDGPSLPGS